MKTPHSQSGVMLLEVLIGMIIFLIGIMGIMGLQAVSMKNSIDARYRSEAGYLANQIISNMWVDNKNLNAYILEAETDCPGAPSATRDIWLCKVIDTLPNASGVNGPTVEVAGSTVTVTIRWRKDDNDPIHRHVIRTDISPT